MLEIHTSKHNHSIHTQTLASSLSPNPSTIATRCWLMPPPQCPTRTASAPCRCATHTPPLVCAPSSSPEKQPYTWAGLNQRNPSNQSVLSRFTMHIQVKFGLVPTRLTEHSENSSSIIVQQAAGPPNKLFNPSSCCNPSLLSSPRYL